MTCAWHQRLGFKSTLRSLWTQTISRPSSRNSWAAPDALSLSAEWGVAYFFYGGFTYWVRCNQLHGSNLLTNGEGTQRHQRDSLWIKRGDARLRGSVDRDAEDPVRPGWTLTPPHLPPRLHGTSLATSTAK